MVEFAQRAEALGSSFATNGEVIVDKCCEFRTAVSDALGASVSVCLDLAHLNHRILDTIPRKMVAYRNALSVELKTALLAKQADGKGSVSEYRPVAEQLKRLDQLFQKYKAINGVFGEKTELTWNNQRIHVARGCVQRRHVERGGDTSSNERWHNMLATPLRGISSSVGTAHHIVHDVALRSNLRIPIHHRSQPRDSAPRQFRAHCGGDHHLFLRSELLEMDRKLFKDCKDLPSFLNIEPTHSFGIVSRDKE